MTSLSDYAHAGGTHETTAVIVTYNGIDKDVAYNAKEAMPALLEAAIRAFDIHDNPHVYALWTVSGVELPNDGSVEAAGVRPGDVLVLRPSAVRGG
jgi:hypothetical protein